MADDPIQNRAELEYTARVNKDSFRNAREEVRRETEQSVNQAKQAATGATTGTAPNSEMEALRRERAERDRLRAERNAQRAKESNETRFISDEEFRVMQRLNTQRNRLDAQEIRGKRAVRDEVVKLAHDKEVAEERAARSGAPRNTIYPGVGPANFNLGGGYRSSLLARADSDELNTFRAYFSGAGGGGGGNRGAGGGGGFSVPGGVSGGPGGGRRPFNPFLLSAGFGALSAGIPGGQAIGGIAVGAGFGGGLPGAAGAAIGPAIGAGIAIIKLYKDQQDELHKLSVALRDVGGDFGRTAASSDVFSNSLGLTVVQSQKLAVSLAELSLKSGQSLGPQAAQQYATIFAGRGLSPEDSEKALKQLASSPEKGFETLTGSRGDITLNRLAAAAGTTTDRLTDMDKVLLLEQETRRRSIEFQTLANARLASFPLHWDSFVNKLSDGAASFAPALLGTIREGALFGARLQTGGLLGTQDKSDQYGGYVYKSLTAEEDARQGELNRQAINENRRKKEEAEFDALQRLQIEGAKRLRDIQKESQVSPLGLTQTTQFGVYKTELENLNRELDRLNSKKAEFAGLAGAKEFDEQLKATTERIEATQKSTDSLFEESRKKVFELSKSFRDSFTDIASLRIVGDSNPYVKLFSDSTLALQRFKEQFPLLGDEAVRSFDRMKQAQIESAVYQQRVTDNLTATKLEFEAAQLAKPFIELTGEMKRTISIFEAEVKNLSGAGLLFQARQIESGGAAQLPFVQGPIQGLPGLQLQGLQSLVRKYAGEGGRGGEEIQHLLNQQFIGLYEKFSPQERQRVFQSGESRFQFANAYRGEERYGREQLDLTIGRAEASRGVVQEAQLQLKELQRLSGTKGADPNVTRSAFLAITGSIPREELTPDLIKGRTEALKEQARFERAKEAEAEKAVAETRKFQTDVLLTLERIQGAIKERSESVLIQVQDATDRTKITLGEGYTPGSSEAQPSPNDLARQIQGLR